MLRPRFSLRTPGALLRAIRKDAAGIAAVEFAILSPLFGVVLAGAIDFGGLLYTKYNLDAVVSSAADYVLVNAASVDSTEGQSLANSIASIIASGGQSNWANATIVVNNGPTATMATGSNSVTTSGTASDANSCYCPTVGSSGVSWGSATPCGNSCPTGNLAGKFVYISASATYSPVFSTFGIVKNGAVSIAALVQAQ